MAALQPEYKLASIWDSDYQNQIVAFHTIGCSRINMSDTVDAAGVPTGEGLSFPACDMMIGAAMGGRHRAAGRYHRGAGGEAAR